MQTQSDRNLYASFTHLLQTSELLRAFFLYLAWLGVWQIGRLVEYTEHASVWFPAAGLTFSCLLILGWRAIPSIMAAAITITIWSGAHYNLPLNYEELVRAGVLFGLAHITPYWIGASIIARLSKVAGHSVPQLIVTFLIVAALSAFAAMILVIISLINTNMLDTAAVSTTWLPFWIGDLAGVIVLSPLFAAILSIMFPEAKSKLSEFAKITDPVSPNLILKFGLNVVLIFLTMILAYATKSEESAFAIFFLAVTHMWIACTESPFVNVLSLALSSFLIALLVHYLGLMDYVMIYQFAINVVAANALFGIAIPQLVADNSKLRKMVFTDTLTQAATREHIQQRAELEIMQSHAEALKLSLVVFDIDHFKQINDEFGHNAGDMALKEASTGAKQCLRPTDVLARYGGDEFVVLLPGSDKQAALKVAERIKNAIRAVQVGSRAMSSSFGVAELVHGDTFSNLFERADKALYASKKAGRNCISSSSSDGTGSQVSKAS